MEGEIEPQELSGIPLSGELDLTVQYQFDAKTAQLVGDNYVSVVAWGYFEIAVLGNHQRNLYLYYPMELDGQTHWFGVAARYDWENFIIKLTIKVVDRKWAIPREKRDQALRDAVEESWYYLKI